MTFLAAYLAGFYEAFFLEDLFLIMILSSLRIDPAGK